MEQNVYLHTQLEVLEMRGGVKFSIWNLQNNIVPEKQVGKGGGSTLSGQVPKSILMASPNTWFLFTPLYVVSPSFNCIRYTCKSFVSYKIQAELSRAILKIYFQEFLYNYYEDFRFSYLVIIISYGMYFLSLFYSKFTLRFSIDIIGQPLFGDFLVPETEPFWQFLGPE